ncbi:hypothetical protein V4833_21920 [Enterobacter sp. HK169]|uniref:hypothetical protein n=1 Tax=Enterobacter sp. HK169 TaxID=1868135 RepID=UPI002F40E1D8
MKIEQGIYVDIEFDIGRCGEATIRQRDDDDSIEHDSIVLDKAGAEKLIEQLARYVSGE